MARQFGCLVRGAIPDEAETAELRRRASQVKALRQKSLDLVAARTGEAEGSTAEAATATHAADLLSDEAAAAFRSARDGAWSAHGAALDRGTADVFEAAMRRDDAAGAGE